MTSPTLSYFIVDTLTELGWVIVTALVFQDPFKDRVPAGFVIFPRSFDFLVGPDYRFAELAICLPPKWRISQEAFKSEDNYWPIRLLKEPARLPHLFDSWLWFGHTVQNGDPLEPYSPDTELCAALLAAPVWFGDDFGHLVTGDDRIIHFFGVVPIYLEEMEFKLKTSSDELFEKLHGAGLAQVVNPSRKNLCKAKRQGLLSFLRP